MVTEDSTVDESKSDIYTKGTTHWKWGIGVEQFIHFLAETVNERLVLLQAAEISHWDGPRILRTTHPVGNVMCQVYIPSCSLNNQWDFFWLEHARDPWNFCSNSVLVGLHNLLSDRKMKSKKMIYFVNIRVLDQRGKDSRDECLVGNGVEVVDTICTVLLKDISRIRYRVSKLAYIGIDAELEGGDVNNGFLSILVLSCQEQSKKAKRMLT